MTLRFKVGDRIAANTSAGWQLGTVVALHYREPDWPEDRKSAPYQIELDEGDMIYAPEDSPELVRAEDQIPWHKKQQRAMATANVAQIYPAKAKHPDLFQPDNVDSWFVPALREALSEWQYTGDPKKIDIAKIPGLRLEAPGVVSFECLQPEFCDKLLEEAKHYSDTGMPQRAPNSMNNYGVVLNEIGLRPSFQRMLDGYMAGMAGLFFGEDDARPATLDGKPADLENWGGATVSDHHTFIVRYRPDEDRHLDMHVDECDVTFNFGLCNPDSFKGSDLAFCGMFGSPEHRKHLHTYAHVKGRCVLHSGKRRHGALNVEEGERASLIMWTKSPAFRQTATYQRRWGNQAVIKPESGTPDRVCLSYTHDRDFHKLRQTLGDATGVMPEPKM